MSFTNLLVHPYRGLLCSRNKTWAELETCWHFFKWIKRATEQLTPHISICVKQSVCVRVHAALFSVMTSEGSSADGRAETNTDLHLHPSLRPSEGLQSFTVSTHYFSDSYARPKQLQEWRFTLSSLTSVFSKICYFKMFKTFLSSECIYSMAANWPLRSTL